MLKLIDIPSFGAVESQIEYSTTAIGQVNTTLKAKTLLLTNQNNAKVQVQRSVIARCALHYNLMIYLALGKSKS
jgi:hypothetical protein